MEVLLLALALSQHRVADFEVLLAELRTQVVSELVRVLLVGPEVLPGHAVGLGDEAGEHVVRQLFQDIARELRGLTEGDPRCGSQVLVYS